MRFTEEHQAIRATTAKFIDAEINRWTQPKESK